MNIMKKKNYEINEILKAFETLENSEKEKKIVILKNRSNLTSTNSKKILILNKLVDKNYNIQKL